MPKILLGYSTWLLGLEAHELLDVHLLEPIVKGDQLASALNEKPGPWMKKALDLVIEWQLRNPSACNPEEAIAEVKRRKDEIGLG